MKPVLKILLISLFCCCSIVLLAACSSEETGSELYPFNPGAAFTTNVKGSKKILKCEMVFQVSDSDAAAHGLSEKSYILRDAVNMALMSLTEEDVTTNLNVGGIKQMIIDAANEALETDMFHDVKFTSFIVA